MSANSARCLLAWGFALLLLFRGGTALRQSMAARDWPAVPATVMTSDARWMEHHRVIGPSMWSYGLDFRYTYVAQGRQYVGTRARFSPWGPSERFNPLVSTLAGEFPAGAKVMAHYDPADPSQSILQTTVQPSVWIALLLGIGLAVLGGKYARRVESDKKRALSTSSPSS